MLKYHVYIINMNEAEGEFITGEPITYEEAVQVKRNVMFNLRHDHFVQILEAEEDI